MDVPSLNYIARYKIKTNKIPHHVLPNRIIEEIKDTKIWYPSHEYVYPLTDEQLWEFIEASNFRGHENDRKRLKQKLRTLHPLIRNQIGHFVNDKIKEFNNIGFNRLYDFYSFKILDFEYPSHTLSRNFEELIIGDIISQGEEFYNNANCNFLISLQFLKEYIKEDFDKSDNNELEDLQKITNIRVHFIESFIDLFFDLSGEEWDYYYDFTINASENEENKFKYAFDDFLGTSQIYKIDHLSKVRKDLKRYRKINPQPFVTIDYNKTELENLTLKELKDLVEQLGLRGIPSKPTKNKLLDFIKNKLELAE